MPRRSTSDFGFPAFRGAVRAFVLASTAAYIVTLLALSFTPALGEVIVNAGMLSLGGVLQGRLWQFITYSFVSVDPLQFVLSMLGVYFIGSAVEQQIGARRFTELYFISTLGAALIGFLLSLTGVMGQGSAFTAGAAANALLMVFYMLNRDAPIMLLPLPIQIPVKYIVILTAAVEGAYLLLTHFALFYVVLLAGLGSGYGWFALARRRSVSGMVGDRWLELRNGYYRWKRRRAARKFEVYMRQNNADPKAQYFDEYGNYRGPGTTPPRERERDDDAGRGKSRNPWVH